jgi:glutamate-1-semialdehyde aminotransferase/acyl carrier protein
MPQAHLPQTNENCSYTEILKSLRSIAISLAGLDVDDLSNDKTFFESGVDSLLLIQAVEEKFQIKLELRLLFEELTTLNALASHLDRRGVHLESQSSAAEGGQAVALADDWTPSRFLVNPRPPQAQHQQPIQEAQTDWQRPPLPAQPLSQPIFQVQQAKLDDNPTEHLLMIPTDIDSQQLQISKKQLAHLQEIISRHSLKTKTSKSLIQKYRARMADVMNSSGFKPLWKELVYPMVVERAKGAKVYDVDGNSYVDIMMGSGVHLLGHAPDCVVEALQRGIASGFLLGAQSKLSGEVAELICDFSGMERATFCNTGTEAMMAAIRLARTVTRRNKIAMFAGAYHGWSDLTLARKAGGQNSIKSLPLVPGIPEKFSEEIVVLDYGSPESLKLLRALGSELAAVLVEPVQSRRPDLQPKEFLHELRRITSQTGAVLIFDEIITGFRIHPGGCQAWFEVKADLAVYGKVIGGGLPIGMVAGPSVLIDAIDGGYWDYADDSYPAAEQTFIAGTFCKHPLAMRTAHAVLTRLKEKGPSLQEELNQSASRLVDSLNQFCSVHNIPAQFTNFGSLFRVLFLGPQQWSSFFYYLALSRGLLVLDGSNLFLSTAHTPADLEFIAATIEQSLLEMMREGWLSEHKAQISPKLDVR